MENKIFAGIRLRLLAMYVDFAILSLPIALLLLYVGTSSNIPIFVQRSFLLLIILLSFIIINLLHDVFFTHYFGGPIGKLLTGLKVIDEHGNFLSLKRSFFRHTVGYQFSAILFGLGFLAIIKDPQKQAWHDKAVGSKVIVEKRRWPLALIVLLMLLILNIFILFSAFNTAFSGPLPTEFQSIINSYQAKQETQNKTPSNPTPNNNESYTSGWQIYHNDEFGFEVRYPNDWKVKDSKEKGSLSISSSALPGKSNSYFLILYTFDETVAKNKERGLSLDDWMKSFAIGRNVRGTPHKMTIGNLEFYGLDATNQESDIYIMDKEKRVYLMSTYAIRSQDMQTLYQILSSFRFVENEKVCPGHNCDLDKSIPF